MLPITENLDDLTVELENSEQKNTKTFGIDLNKNIVGGMIDELEALRQSIYLMLSIEADQYIIYPYTYGMNTLDLIGKQDYYVMAVLPDRIKELLLTDSRIIDVTDFEFESEKNKIHVTFVVHSIYGSTVGETVVTY